jgi:co-chaperonin GroES (HSP10)|tara:strand:+ start:6504 stop:6935 length:432 start_codon:yes stop_codon:yes gene_type:complete
MQLATPMSKSIDNAEWTGGDEILLEGKLPTLPGFNIMVKPVQVKKETKGGILLPDKTQADVAYLTTVGKVVKVGECAYKDEEKFPNGPWCKEGDYVCYGRTVGQKFMYRGNQLLLLFDDQIIMTVEDPQDLDLTFNLSSGGVN